ncbi:MAG: hypothetical protein K2W80_04200, partial [Burkholderiales bacterium]|nr:hypothetical protein [Burkholderiales bacterium]
GAKTIVRPDGGALAPGDIRSPGFHMDLLYHAGTDRWMLRNPAAQSWSAGRNRLANGAFRHAQGNDGSPFVINNGAENDLQDCWTGTGRLSGGVFTVTQMGAGGPPGMPNYSRCTVTAADAAIPAGNAYWVRTNIEGFDIADLGFGTANAQPISVGFWFRSSLAGTFSGTVTNAAANRAYPFSFVYPAANVWQLVAVPNIPGDTVGTWPNNNVRGMSVNFCLGGGASTLAPAGSWQSGGLLGVTGTTNLMAVNGATFDLAAVQLESGVVCTPFEHVPFAVSFARCRRYVQIGAAIIRSETFGTAYAWISFDTPMRAAPSISMGPVSYLHASDATWFNANFTGAELTVTAAAVGGYALISNFTARARL